MSQQSNNTSTIVGDLSSNAGILVAVGVGVGGYLLIKKLGQSLTLFKSPEQIKAEQAAQQAIQENINRIRTQQKTTKTDGEWASIAEAVYRDLRFSATGDNKPDAVYQLCRVKNDADFWTLYKFFGKRQETWFGIIPDGETKDLKMMLKSNLSNKDIATINANYARKKMAFSL